MMNRLVLVASVLIVISAGALADYDVKVELKNVSGQEKTDWPVVLKVYTVLGRNLPAGSVNPDGYHVYDPSGKEVPHAIEVVPPDDVYGNDEIIFVVPRMPDGQTLAYRITNTKAKSALRQAIDYVNSPHNLIPNGDFEAAGEGGAPADFTGQGKQDAQVKRSGKASLVLSADGNTASTACVNTIELHPGSWYYFGVWSKTDNVARFGYQAGPGAHVKLTYADPPTSKPADAAFGFVMPQCGTRDWLKCTFEGGRTDWGMDRYVAQANATKVKLEFVLPQPKHYYMEPGKTKGTWWLDGAALLEQPEVNVRFDQVLEKQLKDGLFVFTRGPEMPLGRLQETEKSNIYKRLPADKYETTWVQMPYAHEALKSLDRSVLKGQRASFCIGLYHTRPVADVLVQPVGLALEGAGGKIALETVEYCPGYLGVSPSRYMPQVGTAEKVEPVQPLGDKGVRYFFVTFLVPRDAKAGKYAGAIEVKVEAKLVQSVPVSLHVQDMAQPVLRDVYVGLIYNGDLPNVDDMLKQYARSGFSQIMWFHGWMPYKKDAQGKVVIDAEVLDKKMKQLLDLGITAGVGLYSDIQLDDKPRGPGRLVRLINEEIAPSEKAATQKAATQLSRNEHWANQKPVYLRVMRELGALVKAHPEWPKVIHMNWDEPPPIDERMGWSNEALPDAISTLDAQFDPLPRILKYYNTPAFDDPADWSGPEVINWCRKQGRDVGLCGATDTAEADRYQAGMLIITGGFKYFHAWHIRGGHTPGQMAYDDARKQTIRGPEMICWGRGMDDLKAHRLLADAIAAAKSAGRNPAAVKAAEDYLKGVFAVFNGDQRKTWSLQPYLGTAWSWGYEQFYDDWQEQMLKHAAAILGAKWVE